MALQTESEFAHQPHRQGKPVSTRSWTTEDKTLGASLASSEQVYEREELGKTPLAFVTGGDYTAFEQFIEGLKPL
jgi:hypothetical protein